MGIRRTRALACTAVLAATLGVAGCKDTSLGADPTSSASSGGNTGATGGDPGATPSAAHGSALAAANALKVKGRAPKTGYSRDQFGPAWADVDHNHCDTRDDILQRDLTKKTYRAGTKDCVITGGTLADPYTGTRIVYKRGASKVDIDHAVALSDAWQKGAQQWSKDRREDFANDPLNLLAVDSSTNRRKSDGDTATWLPPNTSFRCSYVARQVAVKKKYGLSVTSAEQAAMRKVLNTCPKQLLPTG
ncbi:HNH endonuclease family protein [Streptomyces sp. NBC_00669]|uniref:HNH endonuclease family protein n=1 Tax=Streptomyces sp. NBC_00669 TaxID=2976011 RepID=UPI002E34E7E0|nr:HNH endonuclease family protein [Streptomyces sp. NBC_00669]